jgi:FMN-dependent NADH-azoreductase
MKKILHINSSSRSIESGSFSRLYGQKLLQKFYNKFSQDEILLKNRDLMVKNPPIINDEYIKFQNFYMMDCNSEIDNQNFLSKLKPSAVEVIHESQEIIDEFQWADEIIFECPMYNFTFPGNVSAYLALLIVIKKTFIKDDEGYKGLILGKKIYIISSHGGFGFQNEKSFLNFHTPLLKILFKFIGFTEENIQFLFIEKTSQAKADTSHADKFLENL